MAQTQKEIAAGLQISPEFAQITWYDTSMKEPVTAAAGDGDTPELFPLPPRVAALLFPEKIKKEDAGKAEVEKAHTPGAGTKTTDAGQMSGKAHTPGTGTKTADAGQMSGKGHAPKTGKAPGDAQAAGEGRKGPEEQDERRILAVFFDSMLSLIPDITDYASLRLMVTFPVLTKQVQALVPEAAAILGIERRNIYLQDYYSSFYYYTVNQKKELWNGDVVLLEYEEPDMVGSVLHVDNTKRPALVTVKEAARVKVDESLRDGRTDQQWDQEKDRLLFELLKRLFERRNVVTCYLVGSFYDGSWPMRSFQYLCQHRHAFRGGNLYTCGACFAAMGRCGMRRMPDQLFLGSDMIRENLGMNMRVQGKETFHTLISAGVNWYEAHCECEFIPDGEKNVVLITRPMDGGEEVMHVLRLTHFPNRPNRATRLRMTIYFTARDCCRVEVEDCGFGGLYPSEGKVWKRKIRF